MTCAIIDTRYKSMLSLKKQRKVSREPLKSPSKSLVRPAYHWDNTLKGLAADVKKILEQEEKRGIQTHGTSHA